MGYALGLGLAELADVLDVSGVQREESRTTLGWED